MTNTERLRKRIRDMRRARRLAINLQVSSWQIGRQMFPNMSVHDLSQADPRYRAYTTERSSSKPMSPKQRAALKRAQQASARARRRGR